jgi:type VII secretion protein EccB
VSSRQDQLHSYQYSLQRVVAALVTHDPDPSRSPFRRVGSTALVSVLIAMVALGGTAAYAAITNRGASDAKGEGTVYIEKETGAQFIYYKPDGKLHPVLNFSSGLLIIRSPDASSERVPRKTLAKVPRGELMGIPGAPDALPGRDNLTAAPWAVCSQQNAGTPQSVLVIGDPIKGGAPATAGALLVKDPTDTTFLVYGNHKFRIPNSQSVLAAFIWSGQRPTEVAAAWINALPAGPDLAAVPVPRRGERADVPGVDGVRNGDLIEGQDGGGGPSQWKVALDDGAAVISEVQAKLLKNASVAARTHSMPNSRFGNLKPSTSGQAAVDRAVTGHPAAVPTLLPVTQRLCLTVNPKGGATTVLVDPETPPEGNPVTGSGPSKIDRVRVQAGAGVLVESVASPTAAVGSGTVSIVTDDGRRYPIVDVATREFLGFQGVAPQRLPAELVALLPVGPALDPKQAVKAPAEG